YIYQITIAVCFKISRNTHFLANTNMPISAYYFPIVFSHSGILFHYFINFHFFKTRMRYALVDERSILSFNKLSLFICLYLFYELELTKLRSLSALFIRRQEATRFL